MTDPFRDDKCGGDERMVRELVRALDTEASSLDPRVTARLEQVRRQALKRRQNLSIRPRARLARPRYALAGVAVVSLLTAILISVPPSEDMAAPPSVADPATIVAEPVLSGTEELEFYESIDFLLWLENRRA